MRSLARLLLDEGPRGLYRDLGLLLIRVGAGGVMVLSHGLTKLTLLGEGGRFADPIGLGPYLSLVLAFFAEVVCAALIVVGLFTRLACVPLVITMLVAAVVVHGADPWAKKELAVVFAVAFGALAMTGPGRLSLDQLWLGQRR